MYVCATSPDTARQRLWFCPELMRTLMVWELVVNMAYSPYFSLVADVLPNTRDNAAGAAAMYTTAANEKPADPAHHKRQQM